MTRWLLDTNVLSELRKPRPSPKVQAFIAACSIDDLYVSAVTIAEIRFGIELHDDPLRRADLEEWLDHALRPMFAGRVIDLSEDVVLRWRLLVQQGRKTGHTFTQPDLFLAATALHHGLTLVSRDTHDFERTGVTIVNPWM